MGQQASSRSNATRPPISNCPNNRTCENPVFSSKGIFADCPGSTCSGGKCKCGSGCEPWRGTCCRDVQFVQTGERLNDDGAFEPVGDYKCMESSSPPPNVVQPTWATYNTSTPSPSTTRPATTNPTLTPTPIPTSTPTPMPRPSMCSVRDKRLSVSGVTVMIPGSQICNWYRQG